MTSDGTQSRINPQTLDFRAVAKVAQRIRLVDVRLRWSQFGRFAECAEINADWTRKAFLFFDSVAALEDEKTRAQSGDFTVQCIFQLRYFDGLDSDTADEAPEPDEDNPPDVAIEAVFDLIYEIDDWAGTNANDFQHFAFANGTHNAWPYWREFAQSTSVRLGLAPYLVGPFKLPSRDDPPTPGDEDNDSG
jgi:hypothetical protein